MPILIAILALQQAIYGVKYLEFKTLIGHGSAVISVNFSPDGKTIASASEDNTIKLWSVEDRKLIKTLKGHDSTVISVKFSPDGKTIASASFDNTIKLWNLDLDKLLVEGCDLLQDYLINNPQIAKELQVCKSSQIATQPSNPP